MRRVIIAGNWKMNKTVGEAIELANDVKRALYDIGDVEIVLCPPFTCLSDVKEVIMDTNIKLGAQDLYWEKEGPFTGEISGGMLKDVGCEYVIVGHSERRHHFGETNETVNKKAKAALREDLKPIICIGEKLEERKSKKTFDVIKDQLLNSIAGFSQDEMSKVVIAYEPVWAIGTGVNATKDQAEEAHRYIRGLLKGLYGEELAKSVTIQYGGSVTPDNIKELIGEEDVDGALVGGASLKADSFVQIVKNCL